jgi:hypothetical protein
MAASFVEENVDLVSQTSIQSGLSRGRASLTVKGNKDRERERRDICMYHDVQAMY